MKCCDPCAWLDKEEEMRRHNCKDLLCDTPHVQPEPRNLEQEAEEYIRGRKVWEQSMGLCEHGFKRAPGTAWDCHFCVEKVSA